MAQPGGGRWITPGILPSALRAAPQAARSRSLPAILSNHSGGSHPPPWPYVCDLYPSRSPLRGDQAGGGRWIRTTEGVSQQIYSLPPLAAWVSLQQRTRIVGGTCGSVNNNGASDYAHARMAMADLPGSAHPPSVCGARSDRCIAHAGFCAAVNSRIAEALTNSVRIACDVLGPMTRCDNHLPFHGQAMPTDPPAFKKAKFLQ